MPENHATQPFLWGAATAAFQIEGAATAEGKGPSIWDAFCQTPGKISDGSDGNTACDHHRFWADDIAMMGDLGLQAYRFSIAWPRVMPTGRGRLNERGVAFYDRLIDTLCDAGIEPFVTLYHWDLPLALQESLGGWANDELPRIFAEYAAAMFDRFGDRVRYWVTINEPWCVVHNGYFTGVHAPGIEDRALGYRAGHNVLRAHAYAVAEFRNRKRGDGGISLALNSACCYPATPSDDDIQAAERAMQSFAGWFGDPVWFGDYPAAMRERLGDLLPAFTDDDQRLLTRSIDYLGVNYYHGEVVRHAPDAGPMAYAYVPQPERVHTEMGWPIVPEGMCDLLLWLRDRYGDLPFYIMENGIATKDTLDETGAVRDVERIAYLREHIASARRAMAQGVDLRGYFVWSLMDNLEWAAGKTKRFGLVYCDYDTLARTVKASGRWYADFIRADGVEAESAGCKDDTIDSGHTCGGRS